MGAAILQDLESAVLVARKDHGLSAKIERHVIARARHLTHMSDEEPRPPEDALHLELEYRGVAVHSAVDPPGFYQSGDRQRIADIPHAAISFVPTLM
jgi:hypothetical protein